jgi:ribosome-binding protein aMBF1 (putative translation factor)
MRQRKPWTKEQGDIIRDAREAAGMNQKELALVLGVSQRSVGSWERGEHHPLNSIGKLERVLGIRLRENSPERDPLETAIWARIDLTDEAKREMIAAMRRGRAVG